MPKAVNLTEHRLAPDDAGAAQVSGCVCVLPLGHALPEPAGFRAARIATAAARQVAEACRSISSAFFQMPTNSSDFASCAVDDAPSDPLLKRDGFLDSMIALYSPGPPKTAARTSALDPRAMHAGTREAGPPKAPGEAASAGPSPAALLVKHLNIIDPLLPSNNLGRSVSKASFSRIRRAFAYGASTLGDILAQQVRAAVFFFRLGMCVEVFTTCVGHTAEILHHGAVVRTSSSFACPGRDSRPGCARPLLPQHVGRRDSAAVPAQLPGGRRCVAGPVPVLHGPAPAEACARSLGRPRRLLPACHARHSRIPRNARPPGRTGERRAGSASMKGLRAPEWCGNPFVGQKKCVAS